MSSLRSFLQKVFYKNLSTAISLYHAVDGDSIRATSPSKEPADVDECHGEDLVFDRWYCMPISTD